MQIIRAGRLPSKQYQGTCPNCGCVFRCNEAEVKHDYTDPRESWHYVVCPTGGCAKQVSVTKVTAGCT